MHNPLWTAVLHAAQYDATSITARTSSEAICLPHDLQAAVPSCALGCIQAFISSNYHDQTCSSTADIDFLCTTRTTSGLTLGEGSLQCVISNCLGADIETRSGYTICDGVYGAIPNMAETITATVSAISTLLSSADASTPTLESTSLIPSLSETQSSLATSIPPVPVPTEPSAPTPTPSTSETTTAVPSSSISVASPSATSDVVSSASVSANSSAPNATRESASATVSISTTQSSSSTQTTTSSTASGTAAAATESAPKSELSASAIAGIATASVVLAALIIGYLAYLFVVKRKEKQRRRSQRFSSWFPPHVDDTAGSAPPATAKDSQGSSLPSPDRRFYAGQIAQQKRKSLWRRSFNPPPQDIGVAVAASTRVPPKRTNDATGPSATGVLWQSQTQRVGVRQPRVLAEDSRWSMATSFDEDIEAQSQDIPILGSPRARSSGRSFSSVGVVEKPAPLRLSRLKPRSETPPSARMPLTPVYDNGNFEPTIRQVLEDPGVEELVSTVQQPREPQALNFSRRQPSLMRTSQEQPGPFTTQLRQQNPAGRFPIKAQINARKQSETSNQSVSVYTEIEEDDTPEHEEDKQLDKAPTANSAAKRRPLRDLQWPQIPRSAAVARQSQKVHSPRAAMTIRQVDPSPTTLQAQPGSATRDQMIKGGLSFVKTNTSSSSDVLSESSTSPVFPTPPSHRRTNAQGNLTRQISNAYKAASRPTTATTLTRRSRQLNPGIMLHPEAQQPGQRYQQIQRLNTGRPLAQRLQAQGSMPGPLLRSTSRAKVTPMTSSSGDLYLTVGEMEH